MVPGSKIVISVNALRTFKDKVQKGERDSDVLTPEELEQATKGSDEPSDSSMKPTPKSGNDRREANLT